MVMTAFMDFFASSISNQDTSSVKRFLSVQNTGGLTIFVSLSPPVSFR